MADNPIVHIGENSPEYVAYKLMFEVFAGEKKFAKDRTKDEILDLYAECLLAVRTPSDRG